MAGGPATVALAAAVCDAGGLGFLAAGYRTAGDVRELTGHDPMALSEWLARHPESLAHLR